MFVIRLHHQTTSVLIHLSNIIVQPLAITFNKRYDTNDVIDNDVTDNDVIDSGMNMHTLLASRPTRSV